MSGSKNQSKWQNTAFLLVKNSNFDWSLRSDMMKKETWLFFIGGWEFHRPSLLQLIWPLINSIISYLKRKRCFHYSISLSYFNHWRCMLCSTYLTKAPPVPHTRWWDFHQTVWYSKCKIFVKLNLGSCLN